MRKIFLFFMMIIFISQFCFASRRISDEVSFNYKNLDLFNVKKYYKNGNSVYRLKDLSYDYNREPAITDCSISFNNKTQLLEDDSRRYRVVNANYDFYNEKGVLGDGAAFFYKEDHIVKISTASGLWLNESEDLGSFTIEFRFKPVKVSDGAVLVSRVGYMSGVRNGFEIIIENGKVKSHLYNMFRDRDGRPKNFTLSRNSFLKKNKWYYFVLSYDRVTGRITQNINDIEKDTVFASEGNNASGELYRPMFSDADSPLLILGRSYTGVIDEFRITFRDYEDLKSISDVVKNDYRDIVRNRRKVRNREGVVTSPVYEFKNSGTQVKLVKWNETLEKNTFVWMEFRISDSKFDRNNNVLKWYRIKNNQRNIYLKKTENGYLRGKYYQWRLHLIASPDGKHSPEVSNISLQYELDNSPNVPLYFEAAEIGDKYIVLRWKPNVDHDIHAYKIYYGVRSKNYEGVITHINGNIISNSQKNDDGFIEVKIDNAVIIENMTRHRNAMLDYPEIKNTILYFFSVSAYDSYKKDSRHNHESELSEEINARPFAGSEI